MAKFLPARPIRAMFLLLAATLAIPGLSSAQDDAADAAKTQIRPRAWLALPAVPSRAPALGDAEDFDALASLPFDPETIWPREGAKIAWPGEDSASSWSSRRYGDEGVSLGSSKSTALTALAAYLEVDAYTEGEWKWKGDARVLFYLDGAEVLKAAAPKEDAEEPSTEASKKVELEPGTHRLLLFVELDGGEATGDLALELDGETTSALRFGVSPERRLGVKEFLDADSASGLAVSPDGRVVAVGLRRPQAPSKSTRSWVDFLDVESGKVLRSLEGVGEISGLQWAPTGDGRPYAFTSSDDGKTTLWIAEFDGGRSRKLLENQEHFGSFRWAPDGRSIVYGVSEDGPKDPENVKRYRGLSDRWGGARDRTYLYQVSVPDGAVRRLTAGELSTSLQDVAPDSRALLFTRNLRDDASWPFSRDELWELDLRTLEAKMLHEVPWGLSAQYTPDGKQILVNSSASAFGEIGENVPEGVLPNFYDSQLYLMDRDGSDLQAITRDFDPSINGTWFADDGDVLATAGHRSWVRLFRYDRSKSAWSELPVDLDVVREVDVSADRRTLVLRGNGMNKPWQLHAGSLRGGWKTHELRRSDLDVGGNIEAGNVEDFDYVSEDGDTFVGRVYYPPQFDASKQWPAIVYYYGGASPVTRDFGGRYPKELWAAHGYVVYVLQPSGATGFGQAFAARHVNNWGVTVADEIINGTRAFLQAHEFVDPDRVGCIGASYGGFMTELLVTRTDLYAAAVSHAGISSLSSYWGEGNWGFIYSAAATAQSYPWNRPDLYVDQSPLFAADQITTPLLLLHGGDDDNVPPGESEQLYTALRILGREVEYIRVAGERHWILQYDKRMLWSKTILAWFDRNLKGDAGWWDHLYADQKD